MKVGDAEKKAGGEAVQRVKPIVGTLGSNNMCCYPSCSLYRVTVSLSSTAALIIHKLYFCVYSSIFETVYCTNTERQIREGARKGEKTFATNTNLLIKYRM